MKVIILMVVALFFFSCTSMHPNYSFCKETDWKRLGHVDATKDKSLEETFSKYENSCQDFEKYKPDRVMYTYGYNVGVKQFCSYEQGINDGKKGKFDSKVCSPKTHGDYFAGTLEGKKQYCHYQSGVKLGAEGYTHEPKCRKEEFPGFYDGVAEGLLKFCTYAKGLELGSSNAKYLGSCSYNKDKELEFYKGFQVGQQRYTIQSLKDQVAKYEAQLRRANNENSQLRSTIDGLNSQIYSLNSRITELESRPQVQTTTHKHYIKI